MILLVINVYVCLINNRGFILRLNIGYVDKNNDLMIFMFYSLECLISFFLNTRYSLPLTSNLVPMSSYP